MIKARSDIRVRSQRWTPGGAAAVSMVLAVLGAACVGQAPEQSVAADSLTILYPGGDQVLGLPEDDSPKLLAFLTMKESLAGFERDDSGWWIYRLRDDVSWHDGVRMTAADATFTLALREQLGWQTPGRMRWEEIDEQTFRVEYLEMPYGGLLQDNEWDVFYPRHLLEHLDTAEFGSWDYWTLPVGNGPFRVVRHVSRLMFELERFEDFCCGGPLVERVVLKLGGTSLPELLSGEVDITHVTLLEALKLRENPDFRVYYAALPDTRKALIGRHDFPPFDDVRARRAMLMALDRFALAEVLNLPPEVPYSDGMYGISQFLRGEIGGAVGHDPVAAADLLAEADWLLGDDGLRRRGGERLAFKIGVAPIDSDAAVVVQDQLRRLGIEVSIQLVDQGALVQNLSRGEFDVMLTHLTNNLRGRRGLQTLFGSEGVLGYDNLEVHRLVTDLETALGDEQTEPLYERLGAIFEREVPVLYLAPLVGSWAASSRVGGFSTSAAAGGSFEITTDVDLFVAARRLWIDQ